MMLEINGFYILLVIIGFLIYKYVKNSYTYWERLGIPQLPPKFPFGNFGPNFLQKASVGGIVEQMYNSTVEPLIGVYSMLKPTLILRDPKLINTICVNDFQYFMGRGVYSDEKRDLLSGHLFALEGEKWRTLRAKISPTFTPSKIKNMFPIIVKTGETLQRYMNKIVNIVGTKTETIDDNDIIVNGMIDMREVLARYTTDITASVGFGIEINSIENPDEDFRKYGQMIFAANIKNGLRFLIFTVWPFLFKLLRIKMFDETVENFMTNVVKNNLAYREKNNISRQDFFQYLIQLRNNTNNTEEIETESTDNNKIMPGLTIGEMTAQTFVFFVAGFETTSSTMNFFLYEMAKHPDIQQRVQTEIDEILKKYNGDLTYDAVAEMTYLDWCIDEALRLYPPLPIINRVSTQAYRLPDSNINIEKGVTIMISPLGLHRDPKYFPNPEKFIPERFNPENIVNKTFIEMPYLPFGIGPKNCIGLRLGKLQTKIGLIKVLQNCKYHLESYQTGVISENDRLEFTPLSFVLAPKQKILLKVTKR